jgi:serine/threonine-protein kinase RsbW
MDLDVLSIDLPATAANVALIREKVADRAGALGLDRRVVEDLTTVVSEACANVVLHAYAEDEEERPLQVTLSGEGDSLRVTVRDRGQGIQPPQGDRPLGLRMGLLLVGAVSSCFELRSRRGRGTELTLLIPLAAGSA